MKDLTGSRFGHVTVPEKNRNGRVVWKRLWDCGNAPQVRSCDLKGGASTSCGCNQIEFCNTRLKEYQTCTDGTCIGFQKITALPGEVQEIR